MIRVRDLRVDYDDVCAVNDLSLEVAAGEIYGLIGPNGAGKTTTLRTLVGLQEPTYGDVWLNGVDLHLHREDAVRLVGFMPDSAPLHRGPYRVGVPRPLRRQLLPPQKPAR